MNPIDEKKDPEFVVKYCLNSVDVYNVYVLDVNTS